jgi:hypothetical protein
VKRHNIIATHNSRYVSKEIGSGFFRLGGMFHFLAEAKKKRKTFELLRSFVLR